MAKVDLKETELCLGLPGGGVGNEGETAKNSIKRCYSETITDLTLNLPSEMTDSSDMSKKLLPRTCDPARPPAAKAQVVGWPPVQSHRKNALVVGWPPVRAYRKNVLGAVTKNTKEDQENVSSNGASFVKVSMDGAPYLRKVDLKMYKSYQELSDALCKMFSSFTIGNCGSGVMKDFMNEKKLMDSLSGSKYMPTYEDKDGDWMLVGDVPWEMFVDSCKRLRIMKESDAIGLSAPRSVEKYKTRS